MSTLSEVIGHEWMLSSMSYGELESQRYAAVRTLAGEYLVLCRVERIHDAESTWYEYTPLRTCDLRVASEGGKLLAVGDKP